MAHLTTLPRHLFSRLLGRDARDYQILALSLFLALGIGMRDWSLRWDMIALAIATCLVTQLGLSFLLHHWPTLRQKFAILQPSSPSMTGELVSAEPFSEAEHSLSQPARFLLNWRSPLITALSLSLLLRVDHYPTMAFAAAIAIASKFLIRHGDKHVFNPANFGIIAAMLLTQDAWVSPGQWGEEIWYGLIFLGAGGLVLKRVGRWDTSLAFLGSYTLLEAVRNVWLGWTWDVLLHRLMSGSLLLFALFMITDPRSIPNARPGRLIWAVAIAALTFVLRNQFFLSSAVFWALFALAPLTVALDALWPETRFRWQAASSAQLHQTKLSQTQLHQAQLQ